VAYVYIPFHLVEIFVRSAFAEFVALALIPLVFWAFTEVVATPKLYRIALAGLSYGLLALTHHTTFFTFTPLLMVYLLYLLLAGSRCQGKLLWPQLVYTAGAGVLGVALAAIYLLPAIVETRYIKVEQWTSGSYNYLQHFVYFSQLFSPDWGYGYAGPGVLDDLSFQLGIVSAGLLGFALVGLFIRRFPHWGTALFFLVSTLAVIFLMSPLAAPIWRVLPIAALVQFPWRLLGMSAFTISIVAGSLVAEINDQDGDSEVEIQQAQSPTPVYLLALVVILASFTYTLPQYTEVPAWAETSLAVINWDRASIVDRVGMVSVTEVQPQTSPMEQQYLNGEALTVAGIIAGQGTVEMMHHGGASDRVRVTAEEPVTVQFYTYAYPGWQVTLNGQPLVHRPEPPYGLITVEVPPGEHTLLLRMGSTLPRTLGTLISGLALLLIVGFWIKS